MGMDTFEVISRIIPVFLLFLVGYLFRRTGFITGETAGQLKKLVANITLPALMLRAFMSMELDGDRLLLALLMFGICAVLLIGSRLVMRIAGRKNDIWSYMVSGFEAGMLGYALFLSVFGDSALPVFASVDLGQVLFVFVVLMPLLLARSRTAGSEAGNPLKATLRNVLTSPVVWAIIGGLILGTLGRRLDVPARPFAPVSGFLEIIGNLTVPLIALAIGYELDFRKELLGRAAVFVFIRKAILLAIGLLLLRFLPVGDELTALAFMTMLLMPPPFVVTLAAEDEQQGLVSGILSLSTVVSISAFAVTMLLMGG